MSQCNNCGANGEPYRDETSGHVLCQGCGAILDESSWSAEPTFNKEGGQTTVAGHFVSNAVGSLGLGRISKGRILGTQYDPTERASNRARGEIERMVDSLHITPKEDTILSALRLFMMAHHNRFTRGRRTSHVAAASIYIICRQESLPYMLLDFSDIIQVNVFVLGAVFLQLCKMLMLEEHPILTRPVDPSLYLHRFAARLDFGKQLHKVANTALRMISSMKRDWLQTGRRPAGVCGAALYIAGQVHGFEVSRAEVIRVVHVGETTLTKRVDEFSCTDASLLNMEELEEHGKMLELEEQKHLEEIEANPKLALPAMPGQGGCEHLGQGRQAFASGMCKECYLLFIKVSGGVHQSGANPPAYTAGLLKGEAAPLAIEGETQLALPQYAGQGAEELAADFASALEQEESSLAGQGPASNPSSEATTAKLPPSVSRRKRKASSQPEPPGGRRRTRKSTACSEPASQTPSVVDRRTSAAAYPPSPTASPQHSSEALPSAGNAIVAVPSQDEEEEQEDQGNRHAGHMATKETLSDVSDDDLSDCFLSPSEVKAKEVIWTALNQDYIDKQALKAAAKLKEEENNDAQPPDSGDGKRNRGRPRGSRSRSKPDEKITPSETATEGLKKLVSAKKLSDKVNYATLDSLFERTSPVAEPSVKTPPESCE